MKRNIGTMEYVKNYEDIQFRVAYSVPTDKFDELVFAAQPYENMESEELAENPDFFLIYGKMDLSVGLEIGFKDFKFKITHELHQRMGRLYIIIEKECLRIYDNRQMLLAQKKGLDN